MENEDLPETVVTGWRALWIGLCDRSGSSEWCLRGLIGRHVHTNPTPKATHHRWPVPTFWGVPINIPQSAHAGDCPQADSACGYYGLDWPDIEEVVLIGFGMGSRLSNPVIWAHVRALGTTILCEEGWRAESYLIDRLFWPCRDADQTILLPDDHEITVFKYSPDGKWQMRKEALGEILPKLAADLGVSLIREPMRDWWAQYSTLQDAMLAASAQLEDGYGESNSGFAAGNKGGETPSGSAGGAGTDPTDATPYSD